MDIALVFVDVLQGIEHLYIKTKRKMENLATQTRDCEYLHTKNIIPKRKRRLKHCSSAANKQTGGGGQSSGLEERIRELLPLVVT